MPKSQKKKKEKVADFTKAKLKLGKGKQAANNAVDTSYKARSIAVPHQTIGQEKDASIPTTRRNLTLEDVLQHLKHYNSNTRKDAIAGLRELMEGYPHLVDGSLTSVIQTCARLLGDEDAEVRKSLIVFFHWFFRAASLDSIRPHIPMLLLFVTSAQTNIFPAIRIDAVRLLDLLLELTPDLVVQNWSESGSTGSRVLEGLLGLLSVGSNYWKGAKVNDGPIPTASSVTLSASSRLIVLSSLAKFVAIAVSGHDIDKTLVPLWYMARAFSSEVEFQSFSSLIRPTLAANTSRPFVELTWSTVAAHDSNEGFIGDFSSTFLPSTTSSDYLIGQLAEIAQSITALRADEGSTQDPLSQLNTHTTRIAHLTRTLNPILVSTWLDVAPALFGLSASSSKVETEAQLAQAVMQITSCLYGALFRDRDLPNNSKLQALDDIAGLLSYMSPYLPNSSGSSDPQQEEFLKTLSFSYCELISLTALASQQDSVTKQRGASRQKQANALSVQFERVGEYVKDALNGELKSVSHPMGSLLGSTAYTSLLPTIWSLISTQFLEGASGVSIGIQLACIKHAIRVSSRSAAKVAATQFVGTLLLLHGLRSNFFKHKQLLPLEEVEAFREWYQHLPKVLWEIGAGDPTLTETVLRLLLRICQRGIPFFEFTTIIDIKSRLIPFFSTTHPDKGTLFGPFIKLKGHPRLQQLALDVALVLIRTEENLLSTESLKAAVDNAVKDSSTASYWYSHLG